MASPTTATSLDFADDFSTTSQTPSPQTLINLAANPPQLDGLTSSSPPSQLTPTDPRVPKLSPQPPIDLKPVKFPTDNIVVPCTHGVSRRTLRNNRKIAARPYTEVTSPAEPPEVSFLSISN